MLALFLFLITKMVVEVEVEVSGSRLLRDEALSVSVHLLKVSANFCVSSW